MGLADKLAPLRRNRATDPHPEDAPVLLVEDLSVRYGETMALEAVDFHIHSGERVAIVGPNGAGKSTLLQAIAGVIRPTQGRAKIYGHGPQRHRCIAYIPQRSAIDWTFPVTVADAVMMGRTGQIGLLGRPSEEDRQRVRQALAAVGIGALADRPIGELSGGQQQRMFLARALAQDAELLLWDEPFAGLDSSAQAEIWAIFDTLQAQGVTVVLATHNLDHAARHFDRVMVLNRRMVAFGLPDQVVTEAHVADAYGATMRARGSEAGQRGTDFPEAADG